jgi:hypothetical protein
MPDANAIPVIDLRPYLAGEPGALDRAAAELRHALTEIGFYTIVNGAIDRWIFLSATPSCAESGRWCEPAWSPDPAGLRGISLIRR